MTKQIRNPQSAIRNPEIRNPESPARPGVLHNYTRGSDGLYRREMHYARNATEIIVRDSSGRQLYVEHITADVRGQVTCQTR